MDTDEEYIDVRIATASLISANAALLMLETQEKKKRMGEIMETTQRFTDFF